MSDLLYKQYYDTGAETFHRRLSEGSELSNRYLRMSEPPVVNKTILQFFDRATNGEELDQVDWLEIQRYQNLKLFLDFASVKASLEHLKIFDQKEIEGIYNHQFALTYMQILQQEEFLKGVNYNLKNELKQKYPYMGEEFATNIYGIVSVAVWDSLLDHAPKLIENGEVKRFNLEFGC